MGQKSEQRLKLSRVNWEEEVGNGYLLRELFELLLRDPDDLTDKDKPFTMPLETVAEEEGGER